MDTQENEKLHISAQAVRSALVTCTAAVLALVVTVGVLWQLPFGTSGREAVHPKPADVSVMDRFDGYVAVSLEDALADMVPIRWIYTLDDADLIAPEPNPACYGTSKDPSELQWILDAAKETLGVENTIFTTETKIMPGSQVVYYLDDSIFVVTWKQVVDWSVFSMSEVKIAHSSQLRRYLSDGYYGSESLYEPTAMAKTVNAVTASAGDFYNFRPWGIHVYMGQVMNVETIVDSCSIDENGDMLFTRAGEIQTMEQAQAFVEEHNIRFSLAFGPVMVEDGVNVVPSQYPLGEIHDRYARGAFCQVDTLHYLMVASNQQGGYQGVFNTTNFADRLVRLGVRHAYAVDGGQTAAIITNDKLINRPVFGFQRPMSDIIYFATAIPEEKWMEE